MSPPSLSARRANSRSTASRACGAPLSDTSRRRTSRDHTPLHASQVLERDLPPDSTVDDAIARLVVLEKIEKGLAQLDRGEGIPHDEVKRRL